MTITAYTTTRLDNWVTVVATSNLSGVIYYHWYRDGQYLGVTTTNERTFSVTTDEQTDIIAIDTNDAAFDAAANAPDGWPSRHTIHWTRSLDTEVVSYLVEQRQDGGSWSTVDTVTTQLDQWAYNTVTEPLVDLSTYDWRITPLDERGNAGTVTVTDAVKIVHGHNAPFISVTLEVDTTVTIAEVA